jgi:demethylmenaquinone methyltransferase / 2-methoxy-6-polyprenyl-1,4-benzoquinol methylase
MPGPTNPSIPPAASGDTATFGFKTVPAEARQGLINDIFSTVAGRYDLMNDLMSGGLHRLWKDDLIAWLAPPKGNQPFALLDVAGGTGDITLRFLRAGGPGCTATLLDINPEMAAVGRKRLADAGLADRATVVIGNAEALPFPDKSFDAYTIAFGIRNVTHIDRALSEAFRVLKTGGRFLCLEFSNCEVPLLDRLYEFHSFEVIPRLGALAAGAADPYRYLVESIRRFPRQERFAEIVRAAGFARASWRNLTGGIAAIHSGWRI